MHEDDWHWCKADKQLRYPIKTAREILEPGLTPDQRRELVRAKN